MARVWPGWAREASGPHQLPVRRHYVLFARGMWFVAGDLFQLLASSDAHDLGAIQARRLRAHNLRPRAVPVPPQALPGTGMPSIKLMTALQDAVVGDGPQGALERPGAGAARARRRPHCEPDEANVRPLRVIESDDADKYWTGFIVPLSY